MPPLPQGAAHSAAPSIADNDLGRLPWAVLRQSTRGPRCGYPLSVVAGLGQQAAMGGGGRQ
jgi:hypothetical protein